MTLNVAVPVFPVVALTAVTFELPPEADRVTTLPGTAWPFPSLSSTVIIAAVLPSAGSLVGLATTDESAGTGGGAGGLPKVITP